MKVSLVLSSAEDGGLEKHFVELCNELAGRQNVQAVAHPRFARLFADTLELTPLDLSGSRRNPVALFKLVRALRSFAPEVVHAHGNKAAAMVAAIRRWLPAKRVASLHGQNKRLNVFRSFDHVISVSRSEMERIPNPHRSLVFNGLKPPESLRVPTRTELRDEFGIPVEGPLFCSVGRMVPLKRFDLLVKQWSDVGAFLLLVGDGPELAAVRRLVSEAGLGSRIFFAGFRSDAVALMAASDLMIIASTREGFPYTLVEALHVRTPVISTRVSGCTEILPEDYLVGTDDVAGMKELIRRCETSMAAVRQDFEPVFERARRELTLAAMTDRIVEVYRRVLQPDTDD